MSIVKACQKDDIPTNVINMNKDIFACFLVKDFNNCVDKDVFSDELQDAVTSIHKKKDNSNKTNYRPVSILPNENLIYN